jgi:hypothetical protein
VVPVCDFLELRFLEFFVRKKIMVNKFFKEFLFLSKEPFSLFNFSNLNQITLPWLIKKLKNIATVQMCKLLFYFNIPSRFVTEVSVFLYFEN